MQFCRREPCQIFLFFKSGVLGSTNSLKAFSTLCWFSNCVLRRNRSKWLKKWYQWAAIWASRADGARFRTPILTVSRASKLRYWVRVLSSSKIVAFQLQKLWDLRELPVSVRHWRSLLYVVCSDESNLWYIQPLGHQPNSNCNFPRMQWKLRHKLRSLFLVKSLP